jgi:hypothetical protein
MPLARTSARLATAIPNCPAGVPASSGPADGCVVDKIDQFVAELVGFPERKRIWSVPRLHRGEDR